MAKDTSSNSNKKKLPKEKIISTLHKGMWKDSLHSMQPQGTWRDAWSVVIESDDEGNFGASNWETFLNGQERITSGKTVQVQYLA